MNVKEQKRLEDLFFVYGFPVDVPEDLEDRILKLDLLRQRIENDVNFTQHRKFNNKLVGYLAFVSKLHRLEVDKRYVITPPDSLSLHDGSSWHVKVDGDKMEKEWENFLNGSTELQDL